MSIRGQVLADFIAERLDEDGPLAEIPVEEDIPEPLTLFTDGSSCLEWSGAGLILTNPKGTEFTYPLRFKFDVSNNEAEYEALVAGLRIAEQMGVKNLEAKVDSRTKKRKQEGGCSQQDRIHQLRPPNQASLGRSAERKIDRRKGNPCGCGRRRISMDDTAARVPHIWHVRNKESTSHQNQVKTIYRNRWCPVPKGKPQLGEGIKARLDEGSKNWIEEVSHVLWGHRTMIKTSNEDTLFSLTYGTEAVIPAEIGMPSLRKEPQFAKQKSKAKWRSTIMPRSAAQLLSQETSCTATMKLATQKKVENLVQNGKDHTKWWKHLEKEHIRSGTEAKTYSRELGTSKT
ncbi:reverse transcriptase domain-containing protein [Tanacetum coccineum]